MRYYEFSDRLEADACSLAARNRENESILEYKVKTRALAPPGISKDAKKLVANHPNLRVKDGLDPEVIDVDSSFRYTEQTNVREKQQMNVRYFHAVPDLARGVHKPDIESELLSSEISTPMKQCTYKLAEIDYNRFVPFVRLVEENQECARHVPDIYSIGMDSREIVRSQMRNRM